MSLLPQSRQLAVIMFTDIVGYTALMGNDEEMAFTLLNKNRLIQKPIVSQFNGRWIKELGDGVMASFNTVSDAVNAAIKIQENCKTQNDFQLRIGIHMGEVVFENDDVFGDGVNIASRIQTIATPGAIFVSEAVHENLLNKKNFETRFIKKQVLKNVKEPVKVYQVITSAGASTESNIFTTNMQNGLKKFLTLLSALTVILLFIYLIFKFFNSEKHEESSNVKSIAILPFTDMSPEKDQAYLSDGLADEIINSITIIKDLKVIGRTSSFQYKGKDFDARTIGEKLNVNIILEGSIQKSGDVLRIITKLISVKNDSTIWSERFDKESKDIFAIQDSISNKIVEKLNITLSNAEKPRLIKKQTDPEVYSLYLKGLHTYKEGNYDKSIEYNQAAIAMDSTFAPSYAFLALSKIWKINGSASYFEVNEIQEAKRLANKSATLDPNLAEAYSAIALLAWTIEKDFPVAKLNFEKSIQLNPSASLIKNRYAYFLLWMGEFEKAADLGLDAINLDPADWNGYMIVSTADIHKKKFVEAQKYINEGKKLFPDNFGFDQQNVNLKFYSENYSQVIQLLKPAINNSTLLPIEQMTSLCISYFKVGNRIESTNILNMILEKQFANNVNIEYNLARIYAQYQMKDACFASLEKALMKREPSLIFLKIDPLFFNLKKDPRYLQIYHKYGFDSYH